MALDARQEGRRLIAAFAFMTRLPWPNIAWEPDWLPRAAKYFPLAGLAIGLAAAAILALAGRFWPQPIPALLAVAGALLLTGALHEDGLADTFDSLGGRTREARLAIMKDSRLGTFGALALVTCLALRVAALATLPLGAAVAALVGAHAGGRLACVVLMAVQGYGGDPASAKVAHANDRPGPGECALAALFGMVPLLWLGPDRALPALLCGAGAALVLAWPACRALGGYTGDVLGAAEASYETGFLVGAAMLIGQTWS